MLYFNNSATSYPKPDKVIQAVCEAIKQPPHGQFRSGNSLERNPMDACREGMGEILGIKRTDRVFLTSGATDSLNRIFQGLDLEGVPVVVTATEHNSVLRPLFNDPRTRNNLYVVECDAWGAVHPEAAERVVSMAATKRAPGSKWGGLFVLNHCSNVTGVVQDLGELAMIAHRHGFLFLLDASQTAGCRVIDADSHEVDMLVFPGHKHLFGPVGTGGHYVRDGIDLRPMMYGGTGRDSATLLYSAPAGYEHEVGTQNMVGFAGLAAGIAFVRELGPERIERQLGEKIGRLVHGLGKVRRVNVIRNPGHVTGPLLSFTMDGMPADDVRDILDMGFDMKVRSGLHCSPLIHGALGTRNGGTVRVSVSALTPLEAIDELVEAVGTIADGTGRGVPLPESGMP